MVTKKNQVTIYLSNEIRDKVKAIADKERRSFSCIIKEFLIKGLEAVEPGSQEKE